MNTAVNQIPRPEHPRPDFQRDTFFNLNGTWQFAFDDKDEGIREGWFSPAHKLDRQILVPFCYQSKASMIGPTDEIHPIMWYRRSFTVPAEMQGRNILLRFGAVDWEATVYVNGKAVGTHKGGYTPFAFDITPYLADGENDLCVRVVDLHDPIQPRGKQNWNRGLFGCWYTPTSGIWQTVYMEAVSDIFVKYVHITPDIDSGFAYAEIMLNKIPESKVNLNLSVTLNGKEIRDVTASTQNRSVTVPIDMNTYATHHPLDVWTLRNPVLYDVRVKLLADSNVLDRVDTYFGMRKIEVRNGTVYLNNKRLYQRLILDQGYWPDTLITPPSDEAIQEDLRWTLRFGYNGARKHQKVEDPRYYYWADKMGVLVWGELPSPYAFTDETVENLSSTMLEFIERDFNHPCIITWVPLNESWGVQNISNNIRQQNTASMLYYMTKAADGTRLCSGNDGWEQTHTDICGLHDYAADKNVLAEHFADRSYIEANTCDTYFAYANGYKPTGKEAFMVTEFGGISYEKKDDQSDVNGVSTWGYHGKVDDEEVFFKRFRDAMEAVVNIHFCQGYCYTQLTDVMQETNGLLTPDRKPKVDVERVFKLNINPVWHGDRDMHEAVPSSW